MPRRSSSRSSQVTRDHEEIMRWVEERGGCPATVKGTSRGGAGVLRIDFPGQGEDRRMEHLSWDEFFRKFDQENLAFVHQDFTADGEISRFSKFVDAGEAERRRGGDSRGSRRGSAQARSGRGRGRDDEGRSSRSSASRRAGGSSARGSSRGGTSRSSSRGTATRSGGGRTSARGASSRSSTRSGRDTESRSSRSSASRDSRRGSRSGERQNRGSGASRAGRASSGR
mgnify:CR=1 FL=1|jgi:hypothetical protein